MAVAPAEAGSCKQSATRVVNDYDSFLFQPEKNYLEKELVAYRQRTGNVVVVITLPTLKDKKRGTEYTEIKYLSICSLEFFSQSYCSLFS